MSNNFYESFAGADVKSPYERVTGLVFATVAVIFGVLWRNTATVLWSALGAAVMLAADYREKFELD
ncbi:MAG: hypothetical protein ACR2PG_01920 [Hyphomicrobiaceae bacterium]